MAQSNSGIGNVIPNTELVQIAMSYARSRTLCAAACLGVADALGDEVCSADDLAKACQADVDALHRLLRALASALRRKRHRGIFGLPRLEGRCGRVWPSRHGLPSSSVAKRGGQRCSTGASDSGMSTVCSVTCRKIVRP